MAIHIYGEESESSKYIEHSSTYIRPKDHPLARYKPVESVQRERDARCLPTYVSYAESMEWLDSSQKGPRARNSNCDTTMDSVASFATIGSIPSFTTIGSVPTCSVDMSGVGDGDGETQALV